MKKTLISTAILALATLMSVPAAQAKEWKTVTIGLEGAYEPWNLTKPDGTMDGFEVDLAKDLCGRIKVECKYIAQDWDGMIPGLNAGKFDVIMDGMSITAERKKQIDFSRPYAGERAGFATLKSSDLAKIPGKGTIVTLSGDATKDKATLDTLREALKGKSVGVQVATNYAEWLAKNFKDVVTVTEYKTVGEADLDLAAGRVDATVGDITFYASVLPKPDHSEMTLTGPEITGPVWSEGIGPAFRKSDTDLRDMFDKAIGEAQADGTIKKLSLKWFKIDMSPENKS
ncbi:transporter substrate-binding domain-containing protein [Labrys sp. KB_33_2]|uniref:transporter substrate-binding domain-containing protein n=1 Tax=unclassified Labrys (in: a-proteobacteria) TaxID=2688601 RepID=UPI003EBC3F53